MKFRNGRMMLVFIWRSLNIFCRVLPDMIIRIYLNYTLNFNYKQMVIRHDKQTGTPSEQNTLEHDTFFCGLYCIVDLFRLL